jgi:hypothetical protein
MKKIVACLSTALVFVSGCGVPGGGNKHLGGKVQHYHSITAEGAIVLTMI